MSPCVCVCGLTLGRQSSTLENEPFFSSLPVPRALAVARERQLLGVGPRVHVCVCTGLRAGAPVLLRPVPATQPQAARTDARGPREGGAGTSSRTGRGRDVGTSPAAAPGGPRPAVPGDPEHHRKWRPIHVCGVRSSAPQGRAEGRAPELPAQAWCVSEREARTNGAPAVTWGSLGALGRPGAAGDGLRAVQSCRTSDRAGRSRVRAPGWERLALSLSLTHTHTHTHTRARAPATGTHSVFRLWGEGCPPLVTPAAFPRGCKGHGDTVARCDGAQKAHRGTLPERPAGRKPGGVKELRAGRMPQKRLH